MTRYIFYRRKHMWPAGYSYPWHVHAYDTVEKCGFTPQDWNFPWVPTEEYTELSMKDFFDFIDKNGLETVTTHFSTRELLIWFGVYDEDVKENEEILNENN